MKIHRLALSALALAALSAPALALAEEFTMTFDGIPVAVGTPEPPPQDFGSAVLGFYNNDPDYNRDGKQPWNVTFDANALAICGQDLGPSCAGIFPAPPSGISALGWVEGESVRFEVTGGLYVSKMSFAYSDEGTGSGFAVRLFSGTTELLTLSNFTPCGSPFCDWRTFTVPQDDLAKGLVTGVAFLGAANSVVIDDIAVTTTPIPEPSTYALMLAGLALVAGVARRRAS
jgi:hypothetical protein